MVLAVIKCTFCDHVCVVNRCTFCDTVSVYVMVSCTFCDDASVCHDQVYFVVVLMSFHDYVYFL